MFFMVTPTWGNYPIWLIFFKWVETTNQMITISEQNFNTSCSNWTSKSHVFLRPRAATRSLLLHVQWKGRVFGIHVSYLQIMSTLRKLRLLGSWAFQKGCMRYIQMIVIVYQAPLLRRQTLCTSKDETVTGHVCDTTSQWLDQSQDVFYLAFIIVFPLSVDSQDCFFMLSRMIWYQFGGFTILTLTEYDLLDSCPSSSHFISSVFLVTFWWPSFALAFHCGTGIQATYCSML